MNYIIHLLQNIIYYRYNKLSTITQTKREGVLGVESLPVGFPRLIPHFFVQWVRDIHLCYQLWMLVNISRQSCSISIFLHLS